MQFEYLCPKCGGYLKIGDRVVLTVKEKNWAGALLFLHPEIGNYWSENHPSFKFDKGDKFTMYCPICGENLTSEKHENLAMVIMRDENDNKFNVFFSQKAGEKSTFRLVGEHVDVHGEDAENYLDLFSLSRLI
jgi:hypothetical protein